MGQGYVISNHFRLASSRRKKHLLHLLKHKKKVVRAKTSIAKKIENLVQEKAMSRLFIFLITFLKKVQSCGMALFSVAPPTRQCGAQRKGLSTPRLALRKK